MSFFENLRLALAGLQANKMRAMLTMLGIIIGIASVISILTISDGLSSSISSSMGSLGARNITVSLQERNTENNGGMGGFGGGSTSTPEAEDLINEEMIESMQARFSSEIEYVSVSQSIGGGQAKDGRLYANVSVSGINADYFAANNITLLTGRDFQDRDIDGSRMTALVSDKYVNNLYRGEPNAALGQEAIVYIGKDIHAFTIIGVYEYVQSAMGFSTSSEEDISTSFYIPVTTAKKLASADEGYSSVTLVATSQTDNAIFANEVEEYLNRYYINNNDYQISVMNMESMLETMDTMLSTVSLALAVIAGISLLVGGIGVMNILLVSVTERTREIGTRKAIGAKNGNIRIQFVVESIIICLIGGVIGTTIGALLGYLGGSLLGAASWPSVSSIMIAVGFSMAIGIFFGYYPANRAAKMDPIEALRYE